MRDIYYSLINGVASRMVLFAINMIAVRMLTSEDFGFFSYLLTVVSSIAAMSGLGMGVAANKSVAKSCLSDLIFAKKIVFSSFVFVSIFAVLCSFALLPFFDISSKVGFSMGWKETFIIAVFVWLLNLSSVFEGALNGLGAYKNMAFNALKVCLISLPCAFFFLNSFGFVGGIASLLLYRALGVGLNGCLLFQKKILSFRFSLDVLREKDVLNVFVGISLPAMLGSLMVGPAVAAAMNFISTEPNGLKELAYFSWVYQIYTVAIFVPNMLSGYFLSKLSRGDGAALKLFQVIKLNSFFALAVVVLLVFSKAIILRYAGSEYVNHADRIFDLMMVVIVLFGLNSSFASHWVASNQGWLGFLLNLIWAVTLLLVVWLLKKSWGAEALALGFLSAYLMQFVVQASIVALQRFKASA